MNYGRPVATCPINALHVHIDFKFPSTRQALKSYLTPFFIGAMASHAPNSGCGHELDVEFETVSNICWAILDEPHLLPKLRRSRRGLAACRFRKF